MASAEASAATITVNTVADTVANDGTCTLREAIIAANQDLPSGVAAGECAAGAGSDTVACSIPGPLRHVIEVSSSLPASGQTLRIDGDTQPGSDCAAGVFGIALQPGQKQCCLGPVAGGS